MKKRSVYGLLFAKAPPWSREERIFKAKPPWAGNRRNLSTPQLNACIALADAAHAARGTTGKLMYKGTAMPAVAVKVAAAVRKGAKAYGGKTRAERYDKAAVEASISGLRAILAEKGAR